MIEIHHLLASYGVLAIFMIIYLESLGAPLPGESGLIASSLLALNGDLSLQGLLFACLAGAVLGDTTGYFIGYFGGRRLLLRYGHLVRLTPDRLERFEKLFAEKGFYIVMTARFVVLLRQLNGIVAGSMRMPFSHFICANAIGALAWTLVWGLGPYLVTGALAPYVEPLLARVRDHWPF